MITGSTRLIAHLGFPTTSFRAPMIYNPWFASQGIDVVVVPMGVKPDGYAAAFRAVLGPENVIGALVTMPHKVTTATLVDERTTAVRVAGACNAVRRLPDGRLLADMFDGEGFVRGVRRKGLVLEGATCLVAGAGGVGSAIAASLAGAGVGAISLFDNHEAAAHGLADRLRAHHPEVRVTVGPRDPAGHDLVVNATPLGMREGDPLPFDVARLAPSTFVGEVVLSREVTPLIAAARARGCRTQVGTDMLFEMIPAYLEFFGLGTATPEALRATARLPPD